jgi:endonuclease-3
MIGIQSIADILQNKYPWRRWDFGLGEDWKSEAKHSNWIWRHLIKTTLTAHSAEKDVFKATPQLFALYPNSEAMADGDWRVMTDILERSKVKHAGKKAQYIIDISRKIVEEFREVPNERIALESLKGVGRHIASVILATCFNENEFAVDIHVDRISKRLGIVPELARVLQVEKIIQEGCVSNQWGHFSRAFVDFGQTICGFVPKCGECPFSTQCPSSKVK